MRRTTGPVAQVPPGYFLYAQKVTKKAPGVSPRSPKINGGFSDTPASEELRCPVNERILRGSDLVDWYLNNSACRPLKGVEPAAGIAPNRCAANLHRTDVPQQGVR